MEVRAGAGSCGELAECFSIKRSSVIQIFIPEILLLGRMLHSRVFIFCVLSQHPIRSVISSSVC